MDRARAGLAAAAIAAIGLAGCGGGNGESFAEPRRPLRLQTLELVMTSDANERWPAQVELVRVADAGLVSRLLGIEAGTWFDGAGAAFRSAHPDAVFDAWEVVPGTVVGPFAMEVPGEVAGVLFCGLRSPPPPLRFERDGEVTVRIDGEGCSLDGGEPSSEPGLFSRLSPW